MEMPLFQTKFVKKYAKHGIMIGLLSAVVFGASSCKTTNLLNASQTYNEGYVLDQEALDSVSVGSSRDQVLLALGSPSLKAMYGDEIFYYISQTRYRAVQFMKPKIVDRKILAIYFDKNGIVKHIAKYGLQDGKQFDFISKTTPTGGKDQTFLNQLITGTKAVPGGLPTTGR